MAFVIVVPRDGSEQYDSPVIESILDDPQSLTYPARSCQKFSNGSVRIWTYSRNTFVPENANVVDENGVFIGVGCAIVQNEGIIDTKSVFNIRARNPEAVQGDYLIFGLDSNGNGAIYSTTMTFCSLFHHKAENHDIFSTDIGLLHQCLSSRIGKTTGEFFDSNYIFESIENEWGTREFPELTMFNDIKRVLTTTQYQFKNFKLTSQSIQYQLFRPELESMYLEDRSNFYDYAFELIESSIRHVLNATEADEMEILMSGGLDSRLSSALIKALAPDYGISLNATMFGPEDHPDVVIGREVAECLEIPWVNKTGDGKVWMPRSIDDYRAGMKCSWGDWNSNNWRTSKVFQEKLVLSGQDNYKRHNWAKIFSMNRWYAARMSYTSTFPVLSHQIINDMVLIYGKHAFHVAMFEFAFELMKRYSPNLLEIPLVGMQIPQHPIEPYSTVRASKQMPSIDAEAFFDEKIARKLLSSIQFESEREVRIESVLDDKRKKRIVMDYASIMDDSATSNK